MKVSPFEEIDGKKEEEVVNREGGSEKLEITIEECFGDIAHHETVRRTYSTGEQKKWKSWKHWK